MYGDATQTVLNLTSDSGGADAVLSLGVNGQFRHAIGVTGNAASNDLVVGFEGTATELKIKNNVGSGPFDLSGGTDLLTMTDAGRVHITNATEATSQTSGALRVTGGLAVEDAIKGWSL